jgi:hypothetical protein
MHARFAVNGINGNKRRSRVKARPDFTVSNSNKHTMARVEFTPTQSKRRCCSDRYERVYVTVSVQPNEAEMEDVKYLATLSRIGQALRAAIDNEELS